MSTRRRVGFANSAVEASRRQLMQPVPCWEKVWAAPDGAPPGSTLRIYKWVKTDKKQTFSDEEEAETDQPLVPLPEPDEVEVVDGDEEMDQDEVATSAAPETTPASRDVSEIVQFDVKEESLKPASPKPHPLSISFQPPSPTPVTDDALDDALRPAGDLQVVVGAADLDPDMSLDMSQMGPDGEAFEGAQDLSQLQSSDELLGGPLMDQSMEDPFAPPQA